MPRLKLSHWLLFAALAAWALCLMRWHAAPGAFLRGYLPACLFWAWIPLGSLALAMIRHLTGGAWGILLRPALHSAAATLPLTALFFVPLGAGLADIYPWAAETAAWRPAYLEPGLFLARETVVFLLAILCAAGLGVWRPDQPATPVLRRRSAVGMLVYGIAVSTFAVDWIMSLQPRWTSANIGFLVMASLCVGALSFALLADGALNAETAERAEERGGLPQAGSLLLTGILLWAYLEFQQYLTIWSENLPDKIVWYVARTGPGWIALLWAAALCYAAIPFLLLLPRRIRAGKPALRSVAALTLAGNLAYVYWLVAPAYYPTPGGFSLWDLASFVGIGGLWLAAFTRQLHRYRIKEGLPRG